MEQQTTEAALLNSETIKIIYERRAVRKYGDKEVSRDLLEIILDAGRMAPSALNSQPWKFYVVTNKKTIALFSKAIRKAAGKQLLKAGPKKILKGLLTLLQFAHGFHFPKSGDHVFYNAPVVIFITGPKDNEWADLDIGMCAQNMLLAAQSLGLSSCPVGFGKYIEQTKVYSRLQVPSREEIKLSIIFGYGADIPGVHKRNKKNVVFIE